MDEVPYGSGLHQTCLSSLSGALSGLGAPRPPLAKPVFLGLQIDSLTMEVSLPPDKYQGLYSTLLAWSNRKKCQKRELLSLIGKLNFASNVVPLGRTFLWRLIDLSTASLKTPPLPVTQPGSSLGPAVVDWIPPFMEWPLPHPGPGMDLYPFYGALHQCCRWFRVWNLSLWLLDGWPMAVLTPGPFNPVKEALPHRASMHYLGPHLVMQKASISL